MKIVSQRFGELDIKQDQIITLREGLLGLEDLSKFVLIDIKENPAFKWLQCIDNTEITFLLVDPFLVRKNYSIKITDALMEELEINKQEDVLTYTIVTVPTSGFKDATTNLLGPVIINWFRKKGKQIIVETEDFEVRYPLFPGGHDRASKKAVNSGG